MTDSPRAYRAKNPYTPPPREYKHPSMLAQHWVLALVFALLSIAFAVYCFKAPRTPRAAGVSAPAQPIQPANPEPPAPPPTPAASPQAAPIYIEAIPQEGAQRKP